MSDTVSGKTLVIAIIMLIMVVLAKVWYDYAVTYPAWQKTYDKEVSFTDWYLSRGKGGY